MINVSDILNIIQDSEMNLDIDKLDYDEWLTDQGLDSLDMISIMFALEERYLIKIPEEDIDDGKLSSINAIVRYVNRK